MIYEYQCLDCRAVTELECSISERDKYEKELVCASCGGRNLKRIFNAFIPRKGSSSACSSCTMTSPSACSSCPASK